ncbi:MAG TPA: hypothetical protein VK541_15875 [Pedobacter sp.]|uniref:hypothetical protein n=1 Tax=Pedobacter sp. TaxID=1411316 RepID=UPI002B8CFCF7|nr:hypothetical protein [Pedobacter sp.]HMI03965.1 hypothetical protein [Pedobacter sp.]
MKRISIVASLILSSMINLTYAQVITKPGDYLPTVFAPSPNAASLGTYGDIPVTLFNGMPNVNISLYTVKVDNFEMPITLSYHLASVKPEQRPGWVGLGWNLSAGGAITRNMIGNPDEMLDPYASDHSIVSYYTHYDQLNTNSWSSPVTMSNFFDCLGIPACAYPSPDEFSFNFNGISGSFYKNHEGEWVVEANQKIDLKIESELKDNFIIEDIGYPTNPHSDRPYTLKRIIYGFTLTTDDGTQYIFGKTPNSIEFNASTTHGTSDPNNNRFMAKTWYLTKIILPNNKEIVLTYNALEGDSFEYPTNQATNRAVFTQSINTSAMGYIWGSNSSSSGSADYKILSRSYVTYLESITTENTKISFIKSIADDLEFNFTTGVTSPFSAYTLNADYEPGNNLQGHYMANKHWFKLDEMTVLKNSTDLVRKVHFNYMENPTKRLHLTGIEESGLGTSPVIKRHFFTYNSQSLPAYNSKKSDHWGFYNNGTGINNDGVPTDGASYYLTRQPNPSYMQAETLTKIEYPTGGFTSFEYEPHRFSKYMEKVSTGANTTTFGLISAVNNNEIAGGLRIKKITTDPLYSGTPIVKEYFYVKDYKNNDMTPSGIMSGRPVYYESGSSPVFSFMKMSSNSMAPANDTNGSHVTYSTVVEKLADGSFTEFTYSNQDNGFVDQPAYVSVFDDAGTGWINTIIRKMPFNSLANERGNVLFEKKYNALQQLVEETRNTYDTDQTRLTMKIRALHLSSETYGEVVTNGPFTEVDGVRNIRKACAYVHFSNQIILKQKQHIIYDLVNGTNLNTITDYEYTSLPNHHHLRSTKSNTNNATGEYVRTKYFYPMDVEMNGQPYQSDLITKYMTGVPLQTQTFKNTEQLSEQTTQYFPFVSADPLRPILLPQFVYNKIGTSGSAEKKITFKYDTNGHIIEYALENGAPVSIIWGYGATLPVAKLENMAYSSIPTGLITAIQTSSAGSNEAAVITSLNALRSDPSLGSAMVTTYSYIPLIGISTITDPKGELERYTYDDFGRLKWVKDKNGNILSENQYHYKNQ